MTLCFCPIKILRHWFQRRVTRQALLELEPHQLADIGITRQQAQAEASKWFWQ